MRCGVIPRRDGSLVQQPFQTDDNMDIGYGRHSCISANDCAFAAGFIANFPSHDFRVHHCILVFDCGQSVGKYSCSAACHTEVMESVYRKQIMLLGDWGGWVLSCLVTYELLIGRLAQTRR
jgi:uncharacterized Fe-S center protein